MWIRQKRVAVAGVTMMATTLGLAVPSLAGADTESPPAEQAVEVVEAEGYGDEGYGDEGYGDEGHQAEGGDAISCEALFDDSEWQEGDWEDWVPSEDELAEINAETDELVAFLAENGVSVEVETDDLGFSFPVFDEDTSDEVFELVDQFFAERYGDEGWLIDEGDYDGEFEGDVDCFEHEGDFEGDYDDFDGEFEALELDDEDLAELAEEFGIDVEDLEELIELLIG